MMSLRGIDIHYQRLPVSGSVDVQSGYDTILVQLL